MRHLVIAGLLATSALALPQGARAQEAAAARTLASPADDPAPAPAKGDRLAKAMARLDKNHDGFLTRDEVGPMIAQHFDALDTDHDGKLSEQELAGIRAFMGAGKTAATTGDGSTPQQPQRRMRRGGMGGEGGGLGGGRFAQRRGGGGMGQMGNRAARRGDSAEAVAVGTAGAVPTAADIVAQAKKMTTDLGVQGVAVIVVKGDGHGHYRDVVRTYTGNYAANTVEPIASATKWFTAATVATVVDSGKLRFDDPITRYIPDVPADKQAITVRETLEHISGLDADSPMAERSFSSLKQSAASILGKPLVGKPGTVMKYSGTAMQVASRAAEIASGMDFRTLFAKNIAGPLGLTSTSYGRDTSSAPITGGGISTTPADLETFARMIAGRGQANGVRVISEKTMRDMAVLRTKGVEILNIPGAARPFAGMGTGIWCERADAANNCTAMSSVGAFGAYAWVDYAQDEYGVMFIRTALNKAMPYWRGMREAIDRINAAR